MAEINLFNGDKQTTRRVARTSKLEAKRALVARIGTLAASARVLAKAVPDADAKFPLPPRQSDVAVLQAGLLFLKEAVPVKEAFVRCGLPDTFVEELQQAVTAFEQAIAGRHDGKTGSKVAQVAIRAALRRGVDAVHSLDVLVNNALGGDITVMTSWRSKRHVEFEGRTSASATPASDETGQPVGAEPPLEKAS